MTYFPALPLLATNPGDATDSAYFRNPLKAHYFSQTISEIDFRKHSPVLCFSRQQLSSEAMFSCRPSVVR